MVVLVDGRRGQWCLLGVVPSAVLVPVLALIVSAMRLAEAALAQQSFPGLVGCEEAGDLGDGEDEDEVEEQL